MRSFIPNSSHEELLRASLWKGEDAVRSFQAWKSTVALEDIDYPSLRLIPLLYKNLSAHGIKDPLMGRLKGIYRYSWVENHRILSQIPALLQMFGERNIAARFVKGAGLTPLCYDDDLGIRTMGDLDILIPESQIAETVEGLERNGWKASYPLGRAFVLGHRAGNFKRGAVKLDLHWHLLHHRDEPHFDRLFWERAVPVKFRGVEGFTLCAADHLIHTCLHGANWAVVKTVRWASDAYVLIEKTPIEWDRVVSMSQALEVVLPIREMLGYLKVTLRANIPQPVLDELDRVICPAWQKREYEVITHPPGVLGALPEYWIRSTGPVHTRNAVKRSSVFLKYIKERYAAESYTELVHLLARKGWAKHGRRRRR